MDAGRKCFWSAAASSCFFRNVVLDLVDRETISCASQSKLGPLVILARARSPGATFLILMRILRARSRWL